MTVPPQKPAPPSISRKACAGYSPGLAAVPPTIPSPPEPIAAGAATSSAIVATAEISRYRFKRCRPPSEERKARPLDGLKCYPERRQLVSTTSNAEPATRFNARNCSFDQRGSGAPVLYQSAPLSDTIIP